MKLKNKFIHILITVLFAALVCLGMAYHELWRDELEIYARLAFTNKVLMEGDISSIFYYSFLKLFMLINNSEIMYQFAHLIIIVSALYLFIKFAKISNLQKLLFAFSYLIVYEYGVISRYYGFMLLLIFLIVFLITKKEKNYLIIVILILILANHSIQSTIFAASLSIYILLEFLNSNFKKEITTDYKLISAIILFIVGWITIILYHYFITLNNAFFISEGQFGSAPLFINIKSIWNAYLPIPDPKAGIAFWNTNIVNYIMIYPKEYNISDFITNSNILTFLISLVIIFIISIKFSSKPIVLITFLFNTIVYLVFLEILRIYNTRYQGLLFLIFIYNYWLYKNSEEDTNLKFLKKIDIFFEKKFFLLLKKGFKPFLYIILFIQAFSTIYAFSMDIKYKFTISQDAAKYISANNLDKTHVMIGYIDFTTESIAIHTKTKIFFPQVNHYNYYHEPFNKNRKALLSYYEVVASCIKFTEEQNKQVLLILSFPLLNKNNQAINEIMLSGKTKLKFIKGFSGKTIQPDEQYFLYECKMVKQ